MEEIKSLAQLIKQSQNIAIFVHLNPDGDAIGSMLSLGLGLEKIGKKISFISNDPLPDIYKSLPGAQKVKNNSKAQLDLAIAVDCGTAKVLGDSFDLFKEAKTTVAIDHHRYREGFADIGLVDQRAAAVGELIYFLLEELRVKIDSAIAQNLLTSVIVETNSFRLPSVRSLTFEICANLLKSGVDFSKLSDSIYWSKSKQTAILSSICMMRAKYLAKGKIIWSRVTLYDLKENSGKDQDLDAFANEMLTIKEVQLAIFFRQKDSNTLRVSLRSKEKYNVALLAEQFGGGGHFDSAGCIIDNQRQQVNQLLEKAVELLDRPEE
jgi:phosphoesterase RecJ-like protein